MQRKKSPLLGQLAKTVLVLILSAPVVLLLASIQATRLVPASGNLAPSEISAVQNLLVENAPASTNYGTEQEIELSQDELNLLLRYGLTSSGRTQQWSGNLTLGAAQVDFMSTVSIKFLPIRLFINVRGTLVQQDNLLALQHLRIGLVDLPSGLIQMLLDRVVSDIDDSSVALADIYGLMNNVKSLEIDAGSAKMTLLWDPVLMSQLTDQTRQLFVSNEDRKKVAHYYQFLNQIAATTPLDIKAVSLNAYLVPLFAEARAQSIATQDHISENRAAFQALGAFVNQEDIAQLIGRELAQDFVPSNQIEVRVHRREDLAKHLTAIASITSSAGADFASMVSTTKEAYDARYRSGFSFSDLAANTVGVKLASLGTANQDSAARLQLRLAQVKDASEYMPLFGSNTDGLSENDFSTLYIDRNSAEYMLRVQEIESLVSSASVFKDLE
ncbi:MAG: hypothetical protein ACI95C_000678 [Pseudohongiellaceae bacterium]|jgi:hypothetical protein